MTAKPMGKDKFARALAVAALALVLLGLLGAGLVFLGPLGQGMGPAGPEMGAYSTGREQVDWLIASKLTVNQSADLTGACLDLDDDDDTSLCADTDDQIDIEISGADDFQFTADTLTLRSGSTINPENATAAGPTFVISGTQLYTPTSVTVGVIPANADIVDVTLWVETAFDDTGTDGIDCGISGGDVDAYVDNLAGGTAGLNRMGDAADMPISTALGDVGASAITVACSYTGQNGNATAGSATVLITYRID